MNPPAGYEYLLEFFPHYDYRHPNQSERLDYSRPDNVVGHQQRAFNIWWAIEQCWKTGGIGLEIGSGGVHTPWCLSTDAYFTDNHPIYGGACRPHMVLNGATSLPFQDGSFSLVLANHVVEHLPGSTFSILQNWIRVLKSGGIMAMVLPDQQYVDVLAIDKDHKHAWTANQFAEQVLAPLVETVELLEFDTFQNKFSFNAVLRKR